MMTELLQILDELEAQGWVCLLKWDGERASKSKTVVVSKSDKLFRGDFHDFEQALASLRTWLQKEQVVIKSGVALRGESPIDPANKDIDAVAFALDRAYTYLHWIEEHRASFEAARESDPETAEREFGFLAHSIQAARQHMARLVELLMAGRTINPSKRLPGGLAKVAEGHATIDQPELEH